ncbi:MAG: class I SAM-dependent methyltransferase [Clostridia bacterium]|nr:class I SAM-dependent methyltransferase [Clostridia bacterium]
MANLGGAREWARAFIESHLTEGAKVIDATMGNGHDTVWLAKLVGETGKVYAFDVQPEAIANTKKRLEDENLLHRACLYLKGHENIGLTVRSMVDAAVFNLGWLPGFEKSVRTKCDTTLSAVNQALSMLKIGGIMTICVYPGHQEGDEELKALTEWAQNLNEKQFDALIFRYANISKKPPVLIAVTKRK